MSLSKLQRRKFILTAFAAVFFLFAFYGLGFWSGEINKPENKTPQIQDKVQAKQVQLRELLQKSEEALKKTDDYFQMFPPTFHKELESENMSLMIYKNDTLVFWTNFQIPVPKIYNPEEFSTLCTHLKNGWYLSETKQFKDYKLVALSLLKNTYASNQKLLPDGFVKEISLSPNVGINLDTTQNSIYDSNNRYVFSLEYPKYYPPLPGVGIILFFLFGLFVLFFFSVLRKTIMLFFQRKSLLFRFSLMTLCVFSFVILFLYFNIPHFLFVTEPFTKYYNGFLGHSSMGALIILLLVFLQYCYFLAFPEENSISSIPFRKYNFSIALFYGFASKLSVFVYLYLLSDVIGHTDSDGLFLDILNLDLYTFLLLVIISLLTLIEVITVWHTTNLATSYVQRKRFWKVMALSSLPFLLLFFISPKEAALGFFAIIAFNIFFYVFKKINSNAISVGEMFAIVIIFSTVSVTQLMWGYDAMEKQAREALVKTLPIESDPATEILFIRKYYELQKDTVLAQMVKQNATDKELRRYLKQTYFTNYWNQYYFNISLLKPEDVAEKYYNEDYPSATSVPYLYYKNTNWENISYLGGPLLLKNAENDSVFLYLMFSQNRKFGNLRLADLLVHESSYKNYEDFGHYSFAKYEDNKLVQSSGDYHYLTILENPEKFYDTTLRYQYINVNGYSHLVFLTKGGRDCWVVSYKNLSVASSSQIYSFVFLLYCFVAIIFVLVNRMVFFDKGNNFKARLQTMLISLVLVSFISVGVVSVIYINDVNSHKDDFFLKEKLNFLKKEMEKAYDKSKAFDPLLAKKLQADLDRYSKTYDVGITVFNPKGELIVSSSPEIYEAGIVSQFSNPCALKNLQERNMFFFQKGTIGNILYNSSYFMLKNKNNELLGYVEIPTFSRPNEARIDMVTFIGAYSNTYIIFLIISLLVFVVATNFITKPLKIIREQFSKLSLDKKNQRIQWKSNDDLGQLVNAYNNMVDKLEENAFLIAKSERESGWHELARQVAHEIKNPLTPMKLSIQQLQRTWRDNSPDFGERMNKTAQLLIEQIDLLASVADEFSNLAKLSSQKKEKVDLLQSLNSAKELSEVELTDTQIELQIPDHPFVLSDRQQLTRAFINLFKNAKEAVEGDKTSIIHVSVKAIGNFFEIKVVDNGKGISQKAMENLFKPYYTTKKSGTGLGLTIVKGIVEGSGGNIHYISEEGVGTTVVIQLPVYNEDKVV